MEKGWIRVDRSMRDNWIWKNGPFTYAQAWVDLLLGANHKPAKISLKGTLIQLEIGQQARSELTLSKEWGWSRTKVRRFLSRLEGDSMLIQQKTHLTSIITICNYKSFQGIGSDGDTTEKTCNDTTEKHLKNIRKTSDDTQSIKGRSPDNENHENNVNNNLKDYGHFPENEEPDNSDLLNTMLDYHEMNESFTLQQQDNLDGLVSDETAIKESFDKFWNAYAKKKKPKDCLAKWKSKKLYLIADEIMTDIENRMENCNDWRLTGPKARQWQPHPLTYLNSDGWKSELSPKPVEQALRQSQFESKEDRIDRINEENRAKLFGPRKTNQAIEQDFIEGELQHEPRER